MHGEPPVLRRPVAGVWVSFAGWRPGGGAGSCFLRPAGPARRSMPGGAHV